MKESLNQNKLSKEERKSNMDKKIEAVPYINILGKSRSLSLIINQELRFLNFQPKKTEFSFCL